MIGGVVASLAIFNGIYPAITQSTSAIRSAASKVSDRIESRIEIIQVTDNSTAVYLWVKNVGTSRIVDISRSDIFFGPEGDFGRINYGGGTPPYWDYQIEGGHSQWQQAVTVKVTLNPVSALTSGNYIVKMIIPNGISDQTIFSVD